MFKVFTDPSMAKAMVNRPALGWFPHKEWNTMLNDVMMSCAPTAMDQIITMMCGSCSNEFAYKLMFIKYMDKKRGYRDFNQEELDSCMIGKVGERKKYMHGYK
jgi:4-aminobutyrate aminotransferase/(S)-3-amino-2-methylpropionate transaminase